ncbi:hypothetical protein TWF788_006468 [Orbilia oligospora]|uniref:CHK kinase-like domain-containing protein n=1 Tax=Orbilia oligospora TaxID=2813651 RepID=A0A6G1LVQ5_ORBOL|nr:hypothetical protein TWF788_006468 [Orbilia oligospora]KAF3235565.1 hypothetical protein TWF192_000701 [Orbilia oligospora]
MASSILPASYTQTSTTQICSLWSNYGSITRIHISSPKKTTLILKSILPPNSNSNSNSPTSQSPPDESHLRKLISYRVERYFYSHLSPHLSPLQSTKVAEAISINDSTGQLLLEDLSTSYPVTCYGSLSIHPTTTVLTWLAGFHATFWAPEISPILSSKIGSPTAVPAPLSVQSPTTTAGIWERGGYWYLATRTDELNALKDDWHAEDKYLLPWAKDIDRRIQSENKQWKTLIHGDVKGANIFLSSSPSSSNTTDLKAALYDFQYCGISTPAVDLVYFIGTTVDRSLLKNLDNLLAIYYTNLKQAYEATHEGKKLEEETGYSYNTLKEQWDVALVDWMRFMAGWGTWGNWRWVREQAQTIVSRWEAEGRTPIDH